MKPFNKKFVDFANYINWFWPCIAFLRPTPKNKLSPQDVLESILIIDLHLIGDIVLLIPFLKALKKKYPQSKLTLIAGQWANEVLIGENLIDELVVFTAPWVKSSGLIMGFVASLGLICKLNERRWDVGVEVRGDIRQILLLWILSPKFRIGFNFTGGEALLTDVIYEMNELKHLGAHNQRLAEYFQAWTEDTHYVPRITLSSEEKIFASTIRPYIGFHFGASQPLKRFPNEEARKLLLNFSNQDCDLILFLPPDDAMQLNVIMHSLPQSLQDKIRVWSGGLREFIVMCSRAKHCYVMDSGPAHLLAALNIPVTVFFGPTDFQYVHPLGENVKIVKNDDIYCRPCDQKLCINSRYHICMSGLAVKSREL